MSPPRYSPDRFPPRALDWPALLPFIGRAHRAIARYEGVLHGVPNPDILLSPLRAQEAVLSSRIEGTRSSLREVLELDANGTEAATAGGDAQEVLNYHLALLMAVQQTREIPLSSRLIRNTHEILMRGVRGGTADPGQFRRVQNWIGPVNSTEETATFVTCPVRELGDAMTAWERYLHSDAPDTLVQLAVIHAWFEAIHPFVDGNGRMGRLMMPLFLLDKGLLRSPDFYISEVLERHREEYYRSLLGVQAEGHWAPWLRFFLRAVEMQAIANGLKARRLLVLYEEKKEWIVNATHSQHAVRALDFFFRRPVFRSTDFPARSGVPKPTAARLLAILKSRGLLEELRPARGRRAAILYFAELVAIAEQPSDFESGPP